MLTGRNVLCISSIDWDFNWQGHQEIMATLAAQGNRVLFVENTGVRPPRVSDVSRIRSRIRNWWRGTKGFREERRNLFVYSPVVLPFPYSSLARWINRTLMLRALRRWMRAADFHRPIVWTFLPTPLARDLVRELDPALTIYYCIDNFASTSHSARKIIHSENRAFREADLVFVTAERLLERASQFNGHVHYFPFGVNYEAFERVRLSPDAVAGDLRPLPRPVIGFIGGLNSWTDQPLVCAVADAMPEATVALVGPEQTDVSVLRQRRNIHLLGARPHSELPAYIKGFDVGIAPYVMNEHTANIYPAKLNEYLAMGIPVVATGLQEIRQFNARHGSIVVTADTPGAFTAAVREAAAGSPEDAIQRRLRVARENSWSTKIEKMSALIEQALVEREATAERWDVTLGRLYHRARRRMLQVAGALVITYAVLFYTPALWVIASPLLLSQEPQRADAIVVFGGGVGESGDRDSGYQERVRRAVELYEGGFAMSTIFSSGFRYEFTEAEIMRTLAIAEGVAPSDILLEMQAASTRDNVRFVHEILQQHGWRRVLLVSSPYHMRRAMLTWRKLAPDTVVIPTPVERSQFYRHRVGASFRQFRGIAYEYLALVYYWSQGWI